jgi:hypothetical protein
MAQILASNIIGKAAQRICVWAAFFIDIRFFLYKSQKKMKYIFCLFFALGLASCADNHKETTKMQDPNKLKLRLRCSPEPLGIGYANIVSANVVEVLAGELADTTISMTILPNDTAAVGVFFRAAQISGETIDVEFGKHRDNEEHGHTFINGFVGKNRRSWEIVAYEKAK